MTRRLLSGAMCFALATALVTYHQHAAAQESASDSAASDVQAAPPADVNDAPALPPPAADAGKAAGPVLNRADRSLLVKAPEEAPVEQEPVPQATIRSAQDRLPTPVNPGANASARQNDAQAAALRGGILFGRMSQQGLPIDELSQDSVFYRSGLRAGDVVISLGGRPIRSEADFARAAVLTPGQSMPIVVLRNGTQGSLQVDFAPQNAANGRAVEPRNLPPNVYLGVVFDPQARDLAVVQRVNPGSPAAKAGVQKNDIILALNDQEVASAVGAVELIRVLNPGDELRIVVERSRAQRELVATLDAAARQHTVSRPTTMEQPAAVGAPPSESPRAANRVNENDRRYNRQRENGNANERNRNGNEGRGLRLFRLRD